MLHNSCVARLQARGLACLLVSAHSCFVVVAGSVRWSNCASTDKRQATQTSSQQEIKTTSKASPLNKSGLVRTHRFAANKSCAVSASETQSPSHLHPSPHKAWTSERRGGAVLSCLSFTGTGSAGCRRTSERAAPLDHGSGDPPSAPTEKKEPHHLHCHVSTSSALRTK